MRTINIEDLTTKEYPILYYKDGLILLPDLVTCVFYACDAAFEEFLADYKEKAHFAGMSCTSQIVNAVPVLGKIEMERKPLYEELQRTAIVYFVIKDLLLSKGFQVYPI